MKVVGLTGDDVSANPDIEKHAISVGMNSVITKPVDLSKLMSIVMET